MSFTRLTQSPSHLGEGPCWHQDEKVLYWVDILGKKVQRFDPNGILTTSWPLPEMVGTVAPRKSGGLIVALQNGLAFFDPKDGTLDPLPPIDTNPRTRFNDGKCDPQGRFWFGSMDIEEKENLGALYSMDGSGTVKQWAEGIGVSNGMTWSSDQERMYYIDSPTRCVDVFDMDSSNGVISNRRVLFQLGEDEGYPDGMTSDAAGNLWIAHWAGARVTQRNPTTGDCLATFPTQAYQTSACCFGGPDLRDLYVTTAQVNLTDSQKADYVDSGHLLRLRVEHPGVPTHPFCG
jgi:sugar lactone lactonase YvrE